MSADNSASRPLPRRDLFKAVGAAFAAAGLSALPKPALAKDNPFRADWLATDVDGIKLVGIPDIVDPAVVDVAKGDFKNETGVAPHMFADKGGLHVGPDFGYTGDKNPWGLNAKGWEAMYESEGSIQPFSPVTQEVVRWNPPAHQNLPEGGFVFFTGGQMTVTTDNRAQIDIEMPYKKGHNYIFVARGYYPDGNQDEDRNETLLVTGYKPGHLQLRMYPSRLKSNLAFVSEGQMVQEVVTSHLTGTNCGAEGCSQLTLVGVDINTGACQIWRHQQVRTTDLNEAVKAAKTGWQKLYSNF